MSVEDFDVAVVGLGPAGAVAAASLGQAGLRVLVVDKAFSLFDKPRAVGMDHEIMRAFQGLGIADRVAPLTAPFTLSEHFGADGQMIRRVGMLPPPYPMGWTPTMTFHQPQLEQVVRDRIAELPRVDTRMGVELIGLKQDAEGVDLDLKNVDGERRSVRASYVIGCDGASSTVRQLMDIPLEDLGFDEPWLVVDLLANEGGLAKLPRVSTHFCEPSRPMMFVVCTGNHRRFEMMLLPGEDPREVEQEEKVWSLMSRWITRDDAALWRRASYRFHALLANRWRRGRVFIAGDAAHQQPPFLGQGMCQGVRDVINLSWKLQDVIAGHADETILDTYEEERSAHVRTLIDVVKGIGRYICELDPDAARRRDARLLDEAGGVVKTLVRQQLMPGLVSGLFSAAPHPARGTLFPQPHVRHRGEELRLDDVAGSGWRVVLGEKALFWSPRIETPMKLLRVSGEAEANAWQETEGVMNDWMTRHACRAAIVRPDHYVYAVADTAEALDAELSGLRKRLGRAVD